MARVLTTFAALVSFLVVPGLCVGGVISHACDCTSEPTPSCHADCDHKAGCGHEGECPDDPCSVRVVRPDRQTDDIDSVAHTAVSTPIIFTAATPPTLMADRTGEQLWPGGTMLPLLPSDLPLLI